jgi:hypothetical protein
MLGAVEYAPERRKIVLNNDRPLCAFAGIWGEFKGDWNEIEAASWPRIFFLRLS